MIRAIPAEATRPLRQRVLRPYQSLEELYYPGDEGPQTLHLGAFKAKKLVGIISVYHEPPPDSDDVGSWRLRGVATAPEARGQGYGGQLLQSAIAYVAQQKGTFLWCHARTTALDYYRRYGFQPEGEMFESPGTGWHYFIWRAIVPNDIHIDCKNQLTSG